MKRLTERQEVAYQSLLEKPRTYWANKRKPVSSQLGIQMIVMEQLVKKGYATSKMGDAETSSCNTSSMAIGLGYDRRIVFEAIKPRCGAPDT